MSPMPAAFVERLVAASAFRDLPAHLERLCDSGAFWAELATTPEDQLGPHQVQLVRLLTEPLAASGVQA